MSVQQVVPATILNEIKTGLIAVGYAHESTPLSFVQDAYHKYVMVNQVSLTKGFSPSLPYALALLPQAIQEQLGINEPVDPELGTSGTYQVILGYYGSQSLMELAPENFPAINVYINDVKLERSVELEEQLDYKALNDQFRVDPLEEQGGWPEYLPPSFAGMEPILYTRLTNQRTDAPITVRIEAVLRSEHTEGLITFNVFNPITQEPIDSTLSESGHSITFELGARPQGTPVFDPAIAFWDIRTPTSLLDNLDYTNATHTFVFDNLHGNFDISFGGAFYKSDNENDVADVLSSPPLSDYLNVERFTSEHGQYGVRLSNKTTQTVDMSIHSYLNLGPNKTEPTLLEYAAERTENPLYQVYPETNTLRIGLAVDYWGLATDKFRFDTLSGTFDLTINDVLYEANGDDIRTMLQRPEIAEQVYWAPSASMSMLLENVSGAPITLLITGATGGGNAIAIASSIEDPDTRSFIYDFDSIQNQGQYRVTVFMKA